MRPRLLLHICCASCAVYVFKKLSADYSVTGYFFNPNIQPTEEYLSRLKEAVRISRQKLWSMIYGPYNSDDWFTHVKGYEKDPERGKRCSLCFSMRLHNTFEVARSCNYEFVASTLSISPYKVTDQINLEGLELSREFGVNFLPENFKKRDGFRLGKAMAMDLGISHQNYCGCAFSKREREEKRDQKGTNTDKKDI